MNRQASCFSSDLHACPAGGTGVHRGILAQDGNGRGVEVVSLLSAGGVSDVEGLAIHNDQALVRLEGKGAEILTVLWL